MVNSMSNEVGAFEQSVHYLKSAGYDVFINAYSGMEMCFEIIARHHSHSEFSPNLLIKIIDNIDSIKPHIVNELKLIGRLMAAIPLLVASRNRHSILEDDSIYNRDELIAINLNTFHKILSSPHIPLALSFAKKGGLFYDVNGEKMTHLRKEVGMSRKDLAEKLEITPKTVSQYELKGMRASKDNTYQMEKILGETIVEPLDFFQFLKKNISSFKLDDSLQKRISAKTHDFMCSINEIVEDAGYRVFWPRTSPFDLFIFQETEDNLEIADYTFVGGSQCEKVYSGQKLTAQKEFIKQVPYESAVVYDEDVLDTKLAKQMAVPYIIPKELKTLEHPEEFKKLIKKRRTTSQKD